MASKSLFMLAMAGAFLLSCNDSTSSPQPEPPQLPTPRLIETGPGTSFEIPSGGIVRFEFIPKAGARYSIEFKGRILETVEMVEVQDRSGRTVVRSMAPFPGYGPVFESFGTEPVIILVKSGSKVQGAIEYGVITIVQADGDDDHERGDRFGTDFTVLPDSGKVARTVTVGDTDWVRIPVVAGNRYTVAVEARFDPYFDEPVITVFDQDSNTINTRSYTNTFGATRDGFVYVRSYSSRPSSRGAYFLGVTSESRYSDAFEFDDVREAAKAIEVGAAPQQRKLAAGESDWIKFDVVADSTYRITVAGDSSQQLLQTIYADLESQFQTSGRDSIVAGGYRPMKTYTPSRSGTAYLLVSMYGVLPGLSYRVSVARIPNPDPLEPDKSPEAASEIPLGGASPWRFLPEGDVDWFRLAVDSGRRYSLVPEGEFNGIEMDLLDPDSVQLPVADYGPTIFQARSTGFVLVRMRTSPWYAGPYRLAASILADVVDRYEPDDTRQTAKPLTTDGLAQSRHIQDGDHDWIALDLLAGTSYSVMITSTQPSYTIGARILESESTSPIEDVDFDASSQSFSFRPKTSGIHHLELQSYTEVDYSISVFVEGSP